MSCNACTKWVLEKNSFPKLPETRLLPSLFTELFFRIFLNLPLNSIVNIALTCKAFKAIVDSDSFWRELILRDFSSKKLNGNVEFKKIYNLFRLSKTSKTKEIKLYHDIAIKLKKFFITKAILKNSFIKDSYVIKFKKIKGNNGRGSNVTCIQMRLSHLSGKKFKKWESARLLTAPPNFAKLPYAIKLEITDKEAFAILSSGQLFKWNLGSQLLKNTSTSEKIYAVSIGSEKIFLSTLGRKIKQIQIELFSSVELFSEPGPNDQNSEEYNFLEQSGDFLFGASASCVTAWSLKNPKFLQQLELKDIKISSIHAKTKKQTKLYIGDDKGVLRIYNFHAKTLQFVSTVSLSNDESISNIKFVKPFLYVVSRVPKQKTATITVLFKTKIILQFKTRNDILSIAFENAKIKIHRKGGNIVYWDISQFLELTQPKPINDGLRKIA